MTHKHNFLILLSIKSEFLSTKRGTGAVTFTKDLMITSLSNHLGITKTRSTQLIESTFEILKRCLENGEDVLILTDCYITLVN